MRRGSFHHAHTDTHSTNTKDTDHGWIAEASDAFRAGTPLASSYTPLIPHVKRPTQIRPQTPAHG